MYKHAALSPAIQALEQNPQDDAQKQIFETHISEMAYKAFSTQFPDLVENIVTFRLLDSNVDHGTAFGAFIIDLGGETVYAPAVAVDSQLNPIEILYAKSTDKFVPFTAEWIDELQRNMPHSLGQAAKLPDTVPTDVDIRNLVVPPTTGRYSYAQVSDESKLAADASHPLARSLCKRAEEQFDPETWSSFVEQFSRLNGVTPGVALDQGQMDLTLLTKMYKSHVKTWQIPQEAQQQAAEQQIQAQAAAAQAGGQPSQDPNAQAQPPAQAPQDPSAQAQPPAQDPAASGLQAPGQPAQVPPLKPFGSPAGKIAALSLVSKQANALPPVQNLPPVPGLFSRAGSLFDTAIDKGLEGAAVGGAVGGLTGLYDDDLNDVGGRMMRGAAGGALGNVVGTTLGHGFNKRHPNITGGYGDELGSFIGTLGGSIGAARPEGFSLRRPQQQQYQDPYAGYSDPYGGGGMYRMASVDPEVAERDTLLLVKHAAAKPAARPLKLPAYLTQAPNAIKLAFSHTLQKNPSILKFAAETYGAAALVEMLKTRPEAPTRSKTAGISTETFPGLRVAENNKGSKAFGERSPLAFRGVQLRGYYYEDSRPAKNLAVFKQEYHDTHDAREPGVYKLWKVDGSQEPALVLQNPLDLLEDDSPTFPKHDEGITKVKRYAPSTLAQTPEPNSSASLLSYPDPDVERSHKTKRFVIHKNGKYCLVDEVHGEQVTESALKGSGVYNALFTDKKAPAKAGVGFFAYKRGAHYFGTKPVKLENISRDSSGVVTGKIRSVDGWGDKTFRMDPRSPMGRVMRPRGEDFIVIPASWRWVALDGREEDGNYLYTASAVINLALNRLGAMGAHEAVVVSTGADRASIKGRPEQPKVAALKEIADTFNVSGADAEAILKVAELQGKCRALIVPKAALVQMSKFASPVEQAFSEVLQSLQGNLEQLQGQVQVLQSVQQRAQELSGAAGQDPNAMQQTDPAMAAGTPAGGDPNAQPPAGDPNAQAAAPAAPAPQGQPGMDPNAPAQDPNAQAQDPNAPQDPNAQPGQDPNAQPPLPMMTTEGPSSMEIAQQINPTYMQQASQLQDAGAFDIGALAEMERANSEAGGASGPKLQEHTKDLSETVDDLGRTLLTMQLRAVELQEQLGEQGYKQLEEQVRNSFMGLGKLLLDMNQHASALTNAQDLPQ